MAENKNPTNDPNHEEDSEAENFTAYTPEWDDPSGPEDDGDVETEDDEDLEPEDDPDVAHMSLDAPAESGSLVPPDLNDPRPQDMEVERDGQLVNRDKLLSLRPPASDTQVGTRFYLHVFASPEATAFTRKRGPYDSYEQAEEAVEAQLRHGTTDHVVISKAFVREVK